MSVLECLESCARHERILILRLPDVCHASTVLSARHLRTAPINTRVKLLTSGTNEYLPTADRPFRPIMKSAWLEVCPTYLLWDICAIKTLLATRQESIDNG
jgi:hypothetical protein